jgi:hypothetical protein
MLGGQQRPRMRTRLRTQKALLTCHSKALTAPGAAMQLDPRMGTWTCVFCSHSNSDKGLLVLGDAHARPMASYSMAALAVAMLSCSCTLPCMTCTSC